MKPEDPIEVFRRRPGAFTFSSAGGFQKIIAGDAPSVDEPEPSARKSVRWCSCGAVMPFAWCHGRVANAPAHFKMRW